MLGPGFYNMDCMEALKEYPDKHFDLAIVDPPYGDAGSGGGTTDSADYSTTTKWNRFGQRFDRYKHQTPASAAGGGYNEPEEPGQVSTRKKS